MGEYIRSKIIVMWVFWALLSAAFLGIYDIVRKKALDTNAVIPVLFLATLTGAVLFIPLLLLSSSGQILPSNMFYIPYIGINGHLLILVKSFLVGLSWFFVYFAISKLPLTIVIPIRSTAPTWTLIGALIFYGEKYNFLQWSGILIVLIFFYLFVLAGRKEGIRFMNNKWIFLAIGATLLGATSALYDKYLFTQFDRLAVQAWFSVYVVLLILPFFLFVWYPRRSKSTTFRWTIYIPIIGLVLTASDFFYFYSLSHDGALIAALSILRRSSVIISFIAGAVIFKEGNLKSKSIAMAGILIGVFLIVCGSV